MTAAVPIDTTDDPVAAALAPVAKLDRDVKKAARDLGPDEARYLVDLYYAMQRHRLTLANQERALTATGEPTEISHHFAVQMYELERQVAGTLDQFSAGQTVGIWSRAQVGVGAILAAGLLAHIDVGRAPTVGHIWRFAGLDPTVSWGKGEKRPWNARLKTLCWKIGDSFVKQSGRPNCVYGHIYRNRKALEVERNEAGRFADQAAATLASKRITEPATKAVYEAGRLPPGRLDLRARRYAVKLFLAGWHEVAYVDRFGTLPPKPYVIEHLGHAHEFVAPELPSGVVVLRRAVGRPTAATPVDVEVVEP